MGKFHRALVFTRQPLGNRGKISHILSFYDPRCLQIAGLALPFLQRLSLQCFCALFAFLICVSHLPAIQKCPSDSKLRLRTSGRDWSRIRRIFKILAWQFQQSHISIQLSTFRLHTSKRQAGSRMIARGPVLDGTPPSISLRPYVGDVWGCNFPLADAD